MVRYVILVGILTAVVDLLLILGANRLSGHPPAIVGTMAAALISGLHAGSCLTPGFSFLGSGFWRTVILGLMIILAFGMDSRSLRMGLVFLLLKFALSGAAAVFGNGGAGAAVLAAACAAAAWIWGLRGSTFGRELLPVELSYGDRRWKLTALVDTGNMLHDPVTGERVLVAGADMGKALLGLTPGQLSAPVETLAAGLAPGTRLIPYRTVGQSGAMMLALRLRDVKVGSWQGSALVAFAPECFGKGEDYQMLVGGAMG